MRRALLVVLLVGCSKSDEPPAPPVDAGTVNVEGTLAVEIRQSVNVTITPAGELDLVFGEGDFQFFAAGTKLHGKAATERFPEATMTLTTATFALPARADSPCGAQPISLHLSLSRRGTNKRVGGGLTAYCGADKGSGVPARVFRLSGELPLPG